MTRRDQRTAVGTLVLAICALAARAGFADDLSEPIRVAVSAPSQCSDTAEFVARIRARTPRSRLAGESERARSFSVFLSLEPPGARGTLVMTDTEGKALVREVAATNCQEVASALALIAAIAIDPKADTGPVAVSSSTPSASAELAPLPCPAWIPSPSAPCPVCTTAVRPKVPSAERAPSWHLDAGIGGEILGAVAPSPVAAGSLFVDVTKDRSLRRLRLGFVRTTADTIQQVDGTAKLALTAGRLELCPVPLNDGAPIGVLICARMDVGAISGSSQTPTGPHSTNRPWVAAGALAAVRWVPTGWLGVEAHLGSSFPMVRDTFTWHDGGTVHKVPVAGVLGGIALDFVFL